MSKEKWPSDDLIRALKSMIPLGQKNYDGSVTMLPGDKPTSAIMHVSNQTSMNDTKERIVSEPYNGLSPAEAERLDLLAEELCEVGQIIGKIKRHGKLSRHPDGGMMNIQRLEKELGDVKAAMEIMFIACDIRPSSIDFHASEKINRVGQWLHHQQGMPGINQRDPYPTKD